MLVVVFLILALLLRAIVAPLMLIATVVLSFAAALGVSALVFNHVFHFDGADTVLPAVRVRVPGRAGHRLQHLPDDPGARGVAAARHPARRADRAAATGGVITSAGLVLAGTFAVLATLPLVSFAELGFAVAFGVLLDTIDRPLGAGHRAEPGHRPVDVVAEQAVQAS